MPNLSIILQAASNGSQYFIYIFIALLVLILIVALKSSKKENDLPVSSDQFNKVINVAMAGGIIGLFSSSPLNSLNNRIKKENTNGWKVVQIIPADSGNIFLNIFRLLLLVMTLFLFTTSNGYYLIMEKK